MAAQRLRSSSDSATAPPTEILFGLGEKAEEFCEGHARLKNMLERAPSDADNGQAAVEVSRYLPRRWLAAAGGPASPKKKKGVCPCLLCLECWFLKRHAAFRPCPAEGLKFSSIPSSSWLLHELSSKKLKLTLRAFYKRVAENAKDKEKPRVVTEKEVVGARARADLTAAGLPVTLKVSALTCSA